ncbi:MAG: 2-dehydropantoate 2-reductase [Methanomassiliicoccales archaeon]|jgi:2-dehydropantoate 2-reductase
MRVTVFGAGALGSVLGGLMSDSHTVTLVSREDHVREINADGLWLDGLAERKAFPRATVDVRALPVQDLVILTVKAYDTRTALHSIAPLLGEETSLLVIQNGLTVLRDVREKHPSALVGTASLGAQYIGPGHVRLTGLGEIVLGNPDDSSDPCGTALESFRSTGIPCNRSDNMTKDVWKKAVISSCINPVTAITRKRNAIIIDDVGINDLARNCFEESYRVGMSAGLLGPDDMGFTDVEKVARATAGNRSSMLQDIEKGKRTEIHNINGEIVRIGMEGMCDVRVNSILVRLVSALSTLQDTSYDY